MMGTLMQPATIEQIHDTILNAMMNGSGNVMRQGEIDKGRKLVAVGDCPWIPASDWFHDAVVSLHRDRVRIVAVHALNQGSGAFSRMITGIVKAGLHPVVIAPFDDMQQILERWGWHHRIVGTAFEDRYDEWWPTRKWKDLRTRKSE
jgi:hypothetical protein